MDLNNTASVLGNFNNIPTEISSEAVYDWTQNMFAIYLKIC